MYHQKRNIDMDLTTTRPRVLISEEAQQRAREQFYKEEEEARKRQEERERKSDFTDWIQVNKDTTRKLVVIGKDYPSAPTIWNFLTAYMDKYNAIMVSYKAMVEILGLSRATITRSIKALEEAKLLEIYKSGNSNVYILNPGALWSKWSKDKKYCKFSTNIIITLSEQEKEKAKVIQEKLNKVSSSREYEQKDME